jgi:hypothetical protein
VQDIAVDPEGMEPADIVVLHRVVCCYSDYERLLASAANIARCLNELDVRVVMLTGRSRTS